MKRVSKLRSVLTLSVVIHNNKRKPYKYKGLNARLFITQYARVSSSHITAPTICEYLQHCQVKEANDIFMPVKIQA